MSFCYFHGISPVSGGRRVQTPRPNGTIVWHSNYDTMFLLESKSELQGTFRAFSPASESTLPDNTLLMLHGKFAMPTESDDASSNFIIESLKHHLFTMDLEDDECDAFLPQDIVPIIHLLGNVVGSLIHMGDGGKAVDVRVSNYVQNKTMDSLYRCRFPPSPRWAKVNMPIAGSIIAILGCPHSMTGICGTGVLIITVEDIIYNPGTTHILDDTQSDMGGGSRQLQVRKKRKIVLGADGMLTERGSSPLKDSDDEEANSETEVAEVEEDADSKRKKKTPEKKAKQPKAPNVSKAGVGKAGKAATTTKAATTAKAATTGKAGKAGKVDAEDDADAEDFAEDEEPKKKTRAPKAATTKTKKAEANAVASSHEEETSLPEENQDTSGNVNANTDNVPVVVEEAPVDEAAEEAAKAA